jgi:hypothetical protein
MEYHIAPNLIKIVALQKKNGQIHLTQRAQRYHKEHKAFTLHPLR